MNAIRLDRHCYIEARVYEERSFQFLVFSPDLPKDVYSFASQVLQVTGMQILLAQLNIVDAGASGFRDLFQQAATAREFIARKSGAIGDVIKIAAVSHQPSVREHFGPTL
jgi:hypothetical protein